MGKTEMTARKRFLIITIVSVIVLTLTGIGVYYLLSQKNTESVDNPKKSVKEEKYEYYPEGYPMTVEEYNDFIMSSEEALELKELVGDLIKSLDNPQPEDTEFFELIKKYRPGKYETKESFLVDSDGDLLYDWMEDLLFLASGASTDKSLSYLNKSYINNKDSDGDGLYDGVEYLQSLDPYKSNLDIDSDEDGIKDMDEILKYGTESFFDDCDVDGLTDYDEIFKTKTDPLSEDTDRDGADDDIEIEYGLDPKNSDSDGDGISDGDDEIEYTIEAEYEESHAVKVSVTLTAKPENIALAKVYRYDMEVLGASTESVGAVDEDYYFECPEFSKAKITFTIVDKSGLPETATPAVYFVPENLSGMLTKVEDQTSSGDSYTATINAESSYILLDQAEWDSFWEEQARLQKEAGIIIPEPEDEWPFMYTQVHSDGEVKDADGVIANQLEIDCVEFKEESAETAFIGTKPVQNFLLKVTKKGSEDGYINLRYKSYYSDSDGSDITPNLKIMYFTDASTWKEAEYRLNEDDTCILFTVKEDGFYTVFYK